MYDLSGIMVAALKDKVIFRNFVETIPFVQQVFPSMFTAAIMANIIFKLPVGEMFLADKLSAGASGNTVKDKVWLYAVFAFGFVLCWLVPTVLELLENLNIINIY